jgi:cytochrome c oxidase subunit 2
MRVVRAAFILWLATVSETQAFDLHGVPMNYLEAFSGKARNITSLTWMLLIVSILVIAITSILTIVGVWRRRTSLDALDGYLQPVERKPGGLYWITIGVSVSTIVLLGMMGWNAYTMNAIAAPPRAPALTIEVTGQRWWWSFRYVNADPTKIFETANEAHIPTGAPVRIEVKTSDVIHSFWIPAISDKIDLIPNQTNVSWLEADRPGVYRGQCSEYCGQQHAHMGIVVVADSPEDFDSWRNAQLQGASATPGAPAEEGTLFRIRCGACHTVRGTMAQGTFGPDLTHVMSRKGLAANTLSNTIANLSGWIANPQTIKPGCLMPNLQLSGRELTGIRHYVETLK